jgi:uncharacterized lipoprotein YajG
MRKRLLLVVAFLVGCAAAPHNLDNLPLVWMPEKHPRASAGAAQDAFFKTKIKVVQMTDLRDNPKVIGENREKTPARPVTTSDNVAAFVTDQFKALLASAGLTVVDSGENTIIKGEIKQFFVTETEDYVGNVTLHITATDPAGKTLWEGVTSGESSRVGRSYRADNYYQSLSDALSVATSHLLQDSGFQAAIARKQ